MKFSLFSVALILASLADGCTQSSAEATPEPGASKTGSAPTAQLVAPQADQKQAEKSQGEASTGAVVDAASYRAELKWDQAKEELQVHFTAKGEFKCNPEYPHKFRIGMSDGIVLPGDGTFKGFSVEGMFKDGPTVSEDETIIEEIIKQITE